MIFEKAIIIRQTNVSTSLLYRECLYYYDIRIFQYDILTKTVYFILICLVVCFITIAVCLIIGARTDMVLEIVIN